MQMRRLLGFVGLVLCSALSSVSACDKAIVVSYTGEWKPYFYQRSHDRYSGSDYQFLSRVLERLSCQLLVLPMNEKRVSMEIEKGTFDLSLGSSKTPERQQMYHFSQPYRDETIGFAHLNFNTNSKIELESILDAGGKVAINIDGYFGRIVENLRKQYPHQFVHRFALPERLTLMFSGEVDAVVDDKAALCFAQQSYSDVRFKVAQQQLHSNQVHFIFSKRSIEPTWVEAFDHEMQTVIESRQNNPDSNC